MLIPRATRENGPEAYRKTGTHGTTGLLDGLPATIPAGRLGEPSEIARTVAFLAADDAGYITGEDITVNGGLYYH